jgi:hypothetical protein
VTEDYQPVRWVEVGLPRLDDPSRLLFLKADSPWALRPYYRNPDGEGEFQLRLDRRTPEGGITGCLSCGLEELFTTKRFNRTLGIGIVVVAAVLALPTMYISLAVAALLDLVIYHTAPEEVQCYSCGAVHRGFLKTPRHPRFDRTIAERLKFGPKAVMGTPQREGGTADAPDPEH